MDLESLKHDSRNKLVLMYHDIYDTDPNESGFNSSGSNYYKVKVTDFERQVELLSKCNIPHQSIYLTFDDGGGSMYTHAAPILERYNFKGIFCVVYDMIDKKGFLSSSQIEELIARGHIIISHSFSHPKNLTILEEKSHRDEWKKSISELSKRFKSIETRCVAIPNGYYNDIDLDELKILGVDVAFNSKPLYYKNKNGIHIVGRIAINSKTTLKNFIKIVNSSSYRNFLCLRQMSFDVSKSLLGQGNYMKIKRFLRNYKS